MITPNKVKTRIGDLNFYDGMPDKATLAKVYDNLDFIRGVDVFLNFVPATSIEGIRLGVADNTIFIFTADNGPEALDFGSTNLTLETATHGSPGPWRGSLFTGFEGALRVPFVVRCADKIAAGQSSDEIVHAMDLFPTLAKLAGGTVPKDRVIDGIDMSEFMLGKQKKSGRDGFIVYMGKDIFSVKWKNWKLHFKEQDAWNSEMLTYMMPRVYNLLTDPQERYHVLFPNFRNTSCR